MSAYSEEEEPGHANEAARWVDIASLSVQERAQLSSKALGEDVVIVDGLTKSFTLPGASASDAGTVHALHNITLSPSSPIYPIKRGEFVMIRGPSGGGKTTLLNMLGSIDTPTSGTITLFGEDIRADCADAYLADLRLRRVGFVFQTFNLLATMSAFENVELPMAVLGKLSRDEAKARALELLAVVGLQDRAGHLPSELSGGEQQRVTIARALSNAPQLLLLDEPTGDLDTRNTIEVMDLLLKINIERGVTCIMVTHNPDLECYADRILYVQDGCVQKQAINSRQMRLDFEEYMEHVGRAHQRAFADRFTE